MTATSADIVYIALFYVFSCDDLTRPVFNIPIAGTMFTFKYYKYRQLFLTYVIHFLYHYMVMNNIPCSWTLTDTVGSKTLLDPNTTSTDSLSHPDGVFDKSRLGGTHLRLSYHFSPTDQIEKLLDGFRHKDKLAFNRYLCLFLYFRDMQPFYHLPRKHVNHILKIHELTTYAFEHCKHGDEIFHIIPVNDSTYAFKLNIHTFISNTIILNFFNTKHEPIYDPDVQAIYEESLKLLEQYYRHPDTDNAFL